MYTINFSLYKSSQGKVVKSVSEVIPDTVVAILFADFIIETINC